MLNDFDDICLSVVKNLNTRLLNTSLSKLAQNDQMILPPNDYIPKIWENKWYNDETIGGYSKGDVVWKWSITSGDFISNYASLIQRYASNNSRLCSYFKYDPNHWQNEINKYENIISGYSEQIGKQADKTPILKQYYPMLFDYCWNYETNRYAPASGKYGSSNQTTQPVELYISLIDDNKSFLSDSTAWKSIVIRTDDQMKSYLSNEISSMIDQHILDYHLGGVKTLEELDNLLLRKDLKNFNVNDVFNALKVRSHDTYVNGQGFDYVTRFSKISATTRIIPDDNGSGVKATALFKWYRLWNSGYLEHGGTIEIPKYTVSSSDNVSAYEIQVDLNWKCGNDISAPIYDYPQFKTPYYGDSFDLLYFAKTGANELQRSANSGNHLGYEKRYTVSLTPVSMLSNDIASNRMQSFENISACAYPLSANDDKNATWLNFEIYDQTNQSFKIARPRTLDLRDLSCARYIQYYVTGYMAKPNRNYNIATCEIRNLWNAYPYTGSEITLDDIQVYTSDGELLVKDEHYYIDFMDKDHTHVGLVEFRIGSIHPYRGAMHGTDAKGNKLEFRIAYIIDNSTYELSGLNQSYLYGQEG